MKSADELGVQPVFSALDEVMDSLPRGTALTLENAVMDAVSGIQAGRSSLTAVRELLSAVKPYAALERAAAHWLGAQHALAL